MKQDIGELRREAAWCWYFSSKVKPFPEPLLVEIENRLEVLMGQDADINEPTFEEVSKKCNELILIDDTSVRVMVLTSMFLMGYISPHVDVIAGLLSSDEVGSSCDWRSGRVLSQEELGKSARQYLLWVLNIKETDLFITLKEKIDHWSQILGYSDPFESEFGQNLVEKMGQGRESFLQENSDALDNIQAVWEQEMKTPDFQETNPDSFYENERLWAPNPPIVDMDREESYVKEVNGEAQVVTKYLNDEEYKQKKEEDWRRSWEHFQQDISTYIMKYIATSFVEDKKRDVREALKKISRYAFCDERDMSKVALIVTLLGEMVAWNNIPANWLLDAVDI